MSRTYFFMNDGGDYSKFIDLLPLGSIILLVPVPFSGDFTRWKAEISAGRSPWAGIGVATSQEGSTIVGTSRGAFIAGKIAAQTPQISRAILLSPALELGNLVEFYPPDFVKPAWLCTNLYNDRLAPFGEAGVLGGKSVWMSIGVQDFRVGIAPPMLFTYCAAQSRVPPGGLPKRLNWVLDMEPSWQGDEVNHSPPEGWEEKAIGWLQKNGGL